MKIGLFGMYGLYNYGCEAIVRGTYELVKKAWPKCQIVFYTYRVDEDVKILKDLDVIVKPVPIRKNIIFWRVINKILRISSIEKQFSHWDSKKVISDCDLVISVGGDIYTIPKYILDTKSEKGYSPIVEFGKIVVKKIPMIIWGASIGPFGENKKVKDYYLSHLKDIKQIFCREEISYNYLISNGLDKNLQLCSDPAFYIKSDSKSNRLKKDTIKIALNISPLSIKEQVGDDYMSFENDIIQVMIELLSIDNSEITLVPHVISPLSVDDNDLYYMKQIHDKMPSEHKNKIKILEGAEGFLGTKEFLKTCDIAIAARMHCAVNAISEGIPTIFLTYSQKGLGMANYIYGNSKWAIPLIDMEKHLKNKTVEMLSNKEIISKEIKSRIKEIQNDESRIVDLFKKLI